MEMFSCWLERRSDCPKLILPYFNLVNEKRNSSLYFARLADELLRYKVIQTYIFDPDFILNTDIHPHMEVFDNELVVYQQDFENQSYGRRNHLQQAPQIKYIDYVHAKEGEA